MELGTVEKCFYTASMLAAFKEQDGQKVELQKLVKRLEAII